MNSEVRKIRYLNFAVSKFLESEGGDRETLASQLERLGRRAKDKAEWARAAAIFSSLATRVRDEEANANNDDPYSVFQLQFSLADVGVLASVFNDVDRKADEYALGLKFVEWLMGPDSEILIKGKYTVAGTSSPYRPVGGSHAERRRSRSRTRKGGRRLPKGRLVARFTSTRLSKGRARTTRKASTRSARQSKRNW